jgi:hypothetical protein
MTNPSPDHHVGISPRLRFTHKRTRGSHHIYVHPKAKRPLSVQPRGAEAKGYQVAQFMAIVEEYGLTMGDEQ